MRLEAWANDVRRQARFRDDGHRYRNRGVNEDEGGAATAATYHRQLTQRLDAMDRQLAELRKSRAEAPTPETKMEGVPVSRQQAEREPTNAWPRKRVFGERLICWGCCKVGHIRRNCNQPASADKETTTPTDGTTKMMHGIDKAIVYLAMELRGRRCDASLVYWIRAVI